MSRACDSVSEACSIAGNAYGTTGGACSGVGGAWQFRRARVCGLVKRGYMYRWCGVCRRMGRACCTENEACGGMARVQGRKDRTRMLPMGGIWVCRQARSLAF